MGYCLMETLGVIESNKDKGRVESDKEIGVVESIGETLGVVV